MTPKQLASVLGQAKVLAEKVELVSEDVEEVRAHWNDEIARESIQTLSIAVRKVIWVLENQSAAATAKE